MLRYDSAPESIEDYVSMVFQVFKDQVDEDDRVQYLQGMLRMSEEDINYHVYSSTSKLNISWKDCQDDPCNFASYN